ncbi:plasminogen-binding N-terminal domain-containing protein [Sulfurospirillum arcachonense]|uniref:plasminogen-binding N-terminal domain-containing protein n=1 Tax=Sulfurospirillum arcachonense TaxID=57666 RepID=UPI0004683D41|nr:plasminogen-binding N-terminal domain-containing protein [Sulfurospirillum arcachonense]
MRKLLAIVTIFLISWQFAYAKPIFNPFNTEILKISGRNATIKNSKDIVIGSSGIVTHTFKNGISTIVARVNVIKKEADTATVRFEVFKLSAQDAFPKPGILPAVGDKVTLNYLYDRALIVAPNYKVYNEVTKHFKDMEWIHPDVVAAYLAKEFRPNPSRATFREVCKINSAAIIFFALNNNGYFVDCNNFRTIKKVKTARIKKAQAPFYTRVKNIETSWLNWDSSQINDYNSYYRSLIR